MRWIQSPADHGPKHRQQWGQLREVAKKAARETLPWMQTSGEAFMSLQSNVLRALSFSDISAHFPDVSEDVTQQLRDFSARILAGFVPFISWWSLLWGARGSSGMSFVHLDTHTSHWQGKSTTGKPHFEWRLQPAIATKCPTSALQELS